MSKVTKDISYVIHQLESFCQSSPIGRKLLIVSSKQAGYNLTTWLARENIRWVNLRVETPRSLAEEFALPILDADSKRRISSDESVFLVHHLLSHALDGSDDLRRSLSASPGLVHALHRAIVDLRLAGVTAAQVIASGIDRSKALLLGEMYREYEAELAKGRFYDLADIFRVAEHQIDAVAPSDDLIAILDEVDLPWGAFRFTDAMLRRCAKAVRIGRPDFQVDVPAHSAANRFVEIPLAPPGAIHIHPAGQIRSATLAPEDARRVRLRDAVGVEAEVRGVLREIRKAKLPLDTVEIVYTTSEPYLGLIASAAATLDIPVAYSEGLPLRLSRAGQVATGYFRWIASGLDARVLAHLLRARLIRIPTARGAKGQAKATEIAEVLEVRKSTKGRDELPAAFERQRLQVMADEAAGFGRDTDRKLEGLLAGRQVVEQMLQTVPEGSDVRVSELVRSSTKFLKEWFRPAREAEAQTLQSILDRLRDLTHIKYAGSAENVAGLIHDLLSTHRSGASVAREGHIYAVPVERAGYSGRPNTFVIGLDEGSFPGGGIESPILLDAERERISRHLESARSKPALRTWSLLRMLGALHGPVTLVANRFEIIDGRERYASSVYAQCREDLDIKVPVRYSSLFDVEDAVSESDAWLAQRRAADYFSGVARRYPMLAAGLYAAMMRKSPDITRFDGYLGHATPELSLRQGKVVSASRLERLAECPHRYFLQYVLGVDPAEPIDLEDNRWLDAREFGKLVHSLLYVFMSRLQERSERPDFDRHIEEIRTLADEMANEARSRIPPETELAFRASLRRLKASAEVFLAAESRNSSDVQPIDFEMRFGDANEEERHPRPVELDLGSGTTLALRGSIDRVDRTTDGFIIWDYKTGSSASYDRTDPYRGEKLQWALYAFAYEKLMEGLPTHLSVNQSGYFFVGDQEHGRRIAHSVPGRDVVGKYLAPLFDMVEQGGFVHFQKRDWKNSACRFCDYNSICASERRDKSSLPDADESPESVKKMLQPLTTWMQSL